MRTYHLAVFAILFILQFIFVPQFLKAEIPNPCKKSLFFKQTCSTIFLFSAVSAMIIAKNYSVFAILMLVGFCFSWLGDFLLHVRQDKLFFVLGLASFLVGHIFFTSAYCVAISRMFPGTPFLNLLQTIIYVILISALLFSVLKLGADFGSAFLPCFVYMNVVALMVVKAVSFSIQIVSNGLTAQNIYTAAALSIGAILFLASDYMLSMLNFIKGINIHGTLRKINIYTYFFAQMFLATSILFIRG